MVSSSNISRSFTQLRDNTVAVTRQLRWRMEASRWAASAECPHHPTACVGHSTDSAVKTETPEQKSVSNIFFLLRKQFIQYY
jgi:hypothetical protein